MISFVANGVYKSVFKPYFGPGSGAIRPNLVCFKGKSGALSRIGWPNFAPRMFFAPYVALSTHIPFWGLRIDSTGSGRAAGRCYGENTTGAGASSGGLGAVPGRGSGAGGLYPAAACPALRGRARPEGGRPGAVCRDGRAGPTFGPEPQQRGPTPPVCTVVIHGGAGGLHGGAVCPVGSG